MLEIIGSYIIHFISATGYFGIFILMTLESALVPIPSEVTMPFSGSLVNLGQFNFWFVVTAGTFGNLLGSLLAYALGWWGQEAVVRKAIRKFGKYLLVSEHEYDIGERWFRNHGQAIVFISRILPIIRTYISLPAGVAKMNLTKFIVLTTLGSLIWSFILTNIGLVLGKNWNIVGGYFHKFDLVIAGFLVILVIWYVRRKLRHFKKF